MSEPASTKPYLLRAMYEWCVDNGLTPYLAVAVDRQTRVPASYVRDGEIVLNINYSATKDLRIDNDAVTFTARFGGVPFNVHVPVGAVRAIFARENGQGMYFEPEEQAARTGPEDAPQPPRGGKPSLKVVK